MHVRPVSRQSGNASEVGRYTAVWNDSSPVGTAGVATHQKKRAPKPFKSSNPLSSGFLGDRQLELRNPLDSLEADVLESPTESERSS